MLQGGHQYSPGEPGGGEEVEDGRVVSPCAMSGVSGDTVAS